MSSPWRDFEIADTGDEWIRRFAAPSVSVNDPEREGRNIAPPLPVFTPTSMNVCSAEEGLDDLSHGSVMDFTGMPDSTKSYPFDPISAPYLSVPFVSPTSTYGQQTRADDSSHLYSPSTPSCRQPSFTSYAVPSVSPPSGMAGVQFPGLTNVSPESQPLYPPTAQTNYPHARNATFSGTSSYPPVASTANDTLGAGPSMAPYSSLPQHYPYPSRHLHADRTSNPHLSVHPPARSSFSPSASSNRKPYTTPRVAIAPSAVVHPPKYCSWGGGCGILLDDVSGGGVERHLRQFHFNGWDRQQRSSCTWYDGGRECRRPVQQGGLGKHIAARHLRTTASECADCHKVFVRRDVLQKHQMYNCPGPADRTET